MGAIQGATEFVPVSSSAHLVLVPWLLGWPSPGLLFDTTVHWGTLLGALAYFWRDVVVLAAAALRAVLRRRLETTEERWAYLLVVGTLPAVVMGVLWEDFFESLFDSPRTVSLLLMVTGAILYFSERLGSQRKGPEQLRTLDAVFIGIAQSCAIAPGISRSGATIGGGLWRGLRLDVAVRYAFLLSLPIVFGAGLLQLEPALEAGGALDITALAVGFVAAALTGYAAIRTLVRYVSSHRLLPFAVYCWALGLGTLLLGMLR